MSLTARAKRFAAVLTRRPRPDTVATPLRALPHLIPAWIITPSEAGYPDGGFALSKAMRQQHGIAPPGAGPSMVVEVEDTYPILPPVLALSMTALVRAVLPLHGLVSASAPAYTGHAVRLMSDAILETQFCPALDVRMREHGSMLTSIVETATVAFLAMLRAPAVLPRKSKSPWRKAGDIETWAFATLIGVLAYRVTALTSCGLLYGAGQRRLDEGEFSLDTEARRAYSFDPTVESLTQWGARLLVNNCHGEVLDGRWRTNEGRVPSVVSRLAAPYRDTLPAACWDVLTRDPLPSMWPREHCGQMSTLYWSIVRDTVWTHTAMLRRERTYAALNRSDADADGTSP